MSATPEGGCTFQLSGHFCGDLAVMTVGIRGSIGRI